MIDPITDFLNRIRNAQAVSHSKIEAPFSNIKYEIAKILEKQGLIEKVEKRGRKAKRVLEITLKYKNNLSPEDKSGQKQPAISGLKRISKLGQRIYKKSKGLKPVKKGYGIAIISTPQGLMTDKEARKKGLGGEIICEIW